MPFHQSSARRPLSPGFAALGSVFTDIINGIHKANNKGDSLASVFADSGIFGFNAIMSAVVQGTFGRASQILDAVPSVATSSDDLLLAAIDGLTAAATKMWKSIFDYGVPTMSEVVKFSFGEVYHYFIPLKGSNS